MFELVNKESNEIYGLFFIFFNKLIILKQKKDNETLMNYVY